MMNYKCDYKWNELVTVILLKDISLFGTYAIHTIRPLIVSSVIWISKQDSWSVSCTWSYNKYIFFLQFIYIHVYWTRSRLINLKIIYYSIHAMSVDIRWNTKWFYRVRNAHLKNYIFDCASVYICIYICLCPIECYGIDIYKNDVEASIKRKP